MKERPQQVPVSVPCLVITSNVLGFATSDDRREAIKELAGLGWNHFVCFRDVQSESALMYGHANWCHKHATEHDAYGPWQLEPNNIYVNR